MTAAIDTNVLLDILLPDPKHSKSSYVYQGYKQQHTLVNQNTSFYIALEDFLK